MLQTILLSTYLIEVLGLFAIGFLVIVRQKSRPHRNFFIFALCISTWQLLQALSIMTANSRNLAISLFLLSVTLSTTVAVSFYSFVRAYVKKATRYWLMIPGLIIGSLAFLSSNLWNLPITRSNGIGIPRLDIFYGIILAFDATLLLLAILGLAKYYRKTKDQSEKQQTKIILYTTATAGAAIVLASFYTSDFSGTLISQQIIPVMCLFILSSFAYAMVYRRLFDIHMFALRAATYLTSYFMLVLFAVIPVVALTSFIADLNLSFIVIIAISFGVAVFFYLIQSLRLFFDRITSKIFYRDAYNTQDVLDKVSGTIVGNVDPHKIQKGAAEALAEALKPTYVAFVLSSGEMLRRGDVTGQRWNIDDVTALRDVLKKVKKKIIVFDELDEKESVLRNVLKSEDISVVTPLLTKEETIGYLVLGPKKSGNIYNSQDVGLLNIASNELAVALQNAQRFEEIQAFNITLQQKVTEATRELKRTNRKLVALDEAKDEFISMASHQLRTPLTSIKGYLSMLIEGDLGKVSVAQEKALKEAFGSSQRMVYLIADFLNVSRIKTGKFVIEPKEVDLPQVVGEEITQLREMASSRDITLDYEAPGVFPRVQLDDNKIRQVMMNMVDNAIYYTPAGGKVTIQLYVSGEEVVFKVIDTGIGVPKREQHKLFTKFFRANNAKKARPDGTGLGLFMAQKIIVEQGGAIIFESQEGKGSTFGFRFPLKKIKI